MVSFIIPARNEKKYIGDCLASIFSQDFFGDREVIVVDNDSKDGTAEFVRRRYAQAKVVQENRLGINYARQRGFKESSGEVLVFVDADIRLPKDWTRRALAHLNSSSRIAAVSGPYRYYDANKWYLNPAVLIFQFLMSKWAAVHNFISGKNNVLIAGDMMIKRAALEAAGGFDTRFIFFREDVNTAKRLQRFGRVCFFYDLIVESSARRFNQEGLFRLGAEYLYHYFAGGLSNAPAKKGYPEVR